MGRQGRRRATAVVLAAGLFVTGACSAGGGQSATTAGSDTETFTDPQVRLAESPTMVAQSAETNVFDDLPTMVATSDLVVRARVSAVAPGRWVGDLEPGGRERVRDVTLEVEEVLFDKDGGAAPGRVTLDEWGWVADGRGYRDANLTWTAPGDEGYYFLTPVRDAPGHHRLISSQGRALVDGDALVPGSEEGDPLHARTHDLSPAAMESAVARAATAFRAGDVTPQPRR